MFKPFQALVDPLWCGLGAVQSEGTGARLGRSEGGGLGPWIVTPSGPDLVGISWQGIGGCFLWSWAVSGQFQAPCSRFWVVLAVKWLLSCTSGHLGYQNVWA